MKFIFRSYAAIAFLVCPAFVSAQQAFTVHVVPSQLTSIPAVHSGAFAERNGRWIFIGGRKDGIHVMQANQAFPANDRNDSIFVVDPVADTYRAVHANVLPGFLYEAVCSANMQYFQDGSYLYMAGGYGLEDSTQTWITFPSLVSIDLDCLLNKIDSNLPVNNCFSQLIDTNMAVAGGVLEKLDSTYYLVFGHRFDGRYAPPPSPLFTQHYTHEIRKFNIIHASGNLSIANYTTLQDTAIFHRRDFTAAPQIYPGHDRGFTVFGGVFQKGIDRPFLTPIDITSGGYQHQAGFNENLNQYTTAALPVYDSSNNYMHTIFFGGLSQFTLDTATMTLVEDTLVPFVSTISKVTRDPAGMLTESRLQEDMPALKGANAVFIPDYQATWIDNRILNLNGVSGSQRVGYIAGGIHSDFPNVANLDPVSMSRPNRVLYEVFVDKNVSAVPEIRIQNAINNLVVYPNPVGNTLFVNFSIGRQRDCTIKLFDTQGRLVKVFLNNQKIQGEQRFTFSTEGIQDGIYSCRIEAGGEVKVVMVSKRIN